MAPDVFSIEIFQPVFSFELYLFTFLQNMKLLSILNYVSKVKPVIKTKKLTKIIDPEKLKKAELVKKLNKENKLLFGPVAKTKNKNKKIPVKNEVNINKSKENEKSSEFYWLIQHKQNIPNTDNIKEDTKNIEISSSAKLTKTNDANLKTEVNLNQNIGTIPFSAKGLKQIFKFPLVLDDRSNLIEYCENYTGTLPSVGKILHSTMSESSRKMLMDWKLSKIKELGEDGFNKLQQDHLRKGKELHSALELYLKLEIEPKPETEVFKTWQSVLPILKELKPKPELIETFVEHPYLKYKGVVDCVSHIGTNLTVLEWKKSDKPKTTISRTYDAPIQLAAYLGALNSDPKFKFSIRTGYVVVAYPNGDLANSFQLNELEMQKYWQIWLQRLQEYWIRTRDGTLPEPI